MNTGRYHVTLTAAGRPVQHGWWGSEDVAHVTLVDEETGTVLTRWPEGE